MNNVNTTSIGEPVDDRIPLGAGKLRRCTVCGVDKPASKEFFLPINRPCGFRTECRECLNKYQQEYKARDREKWRAYNLAARRKSDAKMTEEQKEQRRAIGRAWQKSNKDKIRANHHRRYRSDPYYKLRLVFGTHVRISLQNRYKPAQWRILLGYTIDELRAHLERQFSRGMSWDNYGAMWQIDHIVPLASFDFKSVEDSDFAAAWALSNLRPLSKKANREKSDKRLFLI